MAFDDRDELPPEGDLDPDLTEDADPWDRPRGTNWRQIGLALVSLLVIVGLVAPLLLRLLGA